MKGLPGKIYISVKLKICIQLLHIMHSIIVLLSKKEVKIAQERSNFVESLALHFRFIKIDSTVINYRFHYFRYSSFNKI